MKIKFLVILILLLSQKTYWSHAQIISTAAGIGIAGYSGDGGFATAARLNNVQQVCIDKTGNIFIADYENHVVRIINSGGIISTFAGNGTAGYSGDAGPAINAQLEYPYGVCTDNTGNIYISDAGRSLIRKVNSNGIISTFAGDGTHGFSGDGGPAIAAQLNTPGGICADNNGNIYIAEFGNNIIRKITTAGIISTVAGSNFSGWFGDGGLATNAQLSSPTDVSVDNNGNIYIADLGNSLIRKVNSAGIITTFAGGAGIGYAGDGGPARLAQLNFPYGVHADIAGNIYIADTQNGVVRKVGSTGIINTFAGNGTLGYSGDGGLATAASLYTPSDVFADNGNHIFIADGTSHVVRKVGVCTPATINSHPVNTNVCHGSNASFTVKASDLTSYQWQVNTGSSWSDLISNSLYSGAESDSLIITGVSNPMNNYVYRCSVKNACGVVLSNPASLNVTNLTTPSILVTASSTTICSGTSSSFTATVNSAGTNPNYQWKRNGMNEGSNSSTYTFPVVNAGDIITCVLNGNAPCATVTSVTSNSITISSLQPPPATLLSTDGSCAGSAMLAISSRDTLSKIIWFNGNTALDTVTATSAATSGITVAGGNGQGQAANQLNSAWTVFLDEEDNIYIADADNNRIQKWLPGAASGITIASGNGFSNQIVPYGVYVDNNKNIYLANFTTHRIQKWISGATSGLTVAGGNGQGSATNQFNSPVGIYVDQAGSLYVTDFNNNRVQKWLFNATSGITVAGGNGAGSAANQLDHPNGDVNIDADGNVYIADGGNYRVVKWAPGAAAGVTVAGGNGPGSAANQLNGVGGIYVDENRNIYIADASNHRIQKWSQGATAGITVAGGNGSGSAANQLSYPNDVFVTTNGDIYIADFYNFRIQKWVQQLTIDTTFQPGTAGSYSALITNSKGCTFTTNPVTINPSVTPLVTISSSSSIICQGTNVNFTASSVNGGLAPLFQWKVNEDVKSAGNIYTTADLNNGDTVTCTLTSNALSCLTDTTVNSNQLIVNVAQRLTPAVSISASPSSICERTLSTFTAAPIQGGTNPSYQWQVNGTNVPENSSTFTTNALLTGDRVDLIMTNNDDCITSSTAMSNTIAVNPPVVSSVIIKASDTVVCKGNQVTFTAAAVNEGSNPAYQWKINGVNAGSNNKVFITTSLQNGDKVSCVITGSIPCTAPAVSNSLTIQVHDVPVVSIRRDTAIAYGSSIILHTSSAGNITSYKWLPSFTLNSDNISSPLATPQTPTTYQLLVTSTQGCTAEADVTISILFDVKVPNAFSPNADGINDVLHIPGLASYPACKVDFYNRYGALLFHSAGYNKSWDGTSNGKALPAGTYYYLIETKKNNQVLKGWITILR